MSTRGYRILTSPAPGAQAPRWLTRAFLYDVDPLTLGPWASFDAITEDLDRLAELGVTGVIIRSVFSVDDDVTVPRLGSRDEFRSLTSAAHDRGLRVLADWPITTAHARSADVRRATRDAALGWVRDDGVDGYRVRGAASVPPEFWTGMLRTMRRESPECALLAGDDARWLHDTGFDASLDLSWTRLWDDCFRGRSGPSDLSRALSLDHRLVPVTAARFRTVSGRWSRGDGPDRAFTRLATSLLLLSPGIPVLSAGQEVGVSRIEASGEPIPFEAGDPDLPPLLSAIGQLRRDHLALREGEWVSVDTDRPGEVFAFARRAGSAEFMVLANLARRTSEPSVRGPAWRDRSAVDLITGQSVTVGERCPLRLRPLSVRILELA